MGQVWLGTHATQNVPVAVKVIAGERGSNPEYRRAFDAEVRAVAGMDHPSIVTVFDHGDISGEAEQRVEGGLRRGSPYLAMEFASLGSLEGLQGTLDWTELEPVIFEVLAGLGHSHARGIVHLDIKPANVLLSATGDVRPGVKLTDFGIAHAASEESTLSVTDGSTGTPPYMAPEQFNGKFRDFGAWTDLYALGCMIWELVCGVTPFDGDTLVELAYQHLRLEPGAFKPKVTVPDGMERWLRRALHKDPRSRFVRAADAMNELSLLVEPSPPWWLSRRGKIIPLLDRLEREGRTVGETGVESAVQSAWAATIQAEVIDLDRGRPTQVTQTDGWSAPPMPDSPDQSRLRCGSMQLVGAGFGLYGVRAVPMAGRDAERKSLWGLLGEVRNSGSTRVVLLDGPQGVGKSRLAQWLSRRAHELGAAVTLSATHTAHGGADDGLGRLVARRFRSVGLTYPETVARAEEHLRSLDAEDEDHFEWEHLSQLACPELGAGVNEVPTAERHLALQRLLRRIGRERPVVLWLDDVHWGADALLFVDRLLEGAHDFPVLVVATYQPSHLEDRIVENVLLGRIARHEVTTVLPVGPLEEADCLSLVETLLGLETDLATEVARCSGGSPLFVIQLVGDWVQRGVLDVGEFGFRLREGESIALPRTVNEVVSERIERVLEGHEPAARISLELAAVLGRDVDQGEWAAACEQVGVSPSRGVMDTLHDQRIIVTTERGWQFVHNVIRDAMLASAKRGGRLQAHHGACADVLLDKAPHVALALRLAHHCRGAARTGMALDHLIAAIIHLTEDGRYERADALLADYRKRVDEMGCLPDDLRRGRGTMARVAVLIGTGQLEDAKSVAAALLDRARETEWQELVPESEDALGDIARAQGDMDDAAEHYRQALTGYERQSRHRERALVVFDLADLATQRGELSRAAVLYAQGRDILESVSDETGGALCDLGLARAAIQGDDLDLAGTLVQRATEVFEKEGLQSRVMDCKHAAGDVERLKGDRDLAESLYRQALAFYEAVGSGSAAHVHLSMALMSIALAQFDDAAAVLDQCMEAFVRSGERDDQGRVHAALLAVASGRADWTAWDEHLHQAVSLLEQTTRVDRDVAWLARFASGFAMVHGESDRANLAEELARSQEAKLKGVDLRLGDGPQIV
jgi:serine/threonine protein kinase/tetratricopeptide (TPR) repeat protein